MTTISEALTWYWNVMFESTLYSVFFLVLVIAAILYYSKLKKLAIRWGCVPRSASYQIDV